MSRYELGGRQAGACPTWLPDGCDPNEYRLVTGTFKHTSGEVYDLKLESESKPIGVTATHPFWSVDREAWVSAINLEIGETLRTLEGTTVVEGRSKREEPETVYNIEVEGDHVYRVGESGALVHNASAACDIHIVEREGEEIVCEIHTAEGVLEFHATETFECNGNLVILDHFHIGPQDPGVDYSPGPAFLIRCARQYCRNVNAREIEIRGGKRGTHSAHPGTIPEPIRLSCD